MSWRELRALGITIAIVYVQTVNINNYINQNNTNIAIVRMVTQVNPFYNVINFNTD